MFTRAFQILQEKNMSHVKFAMQFAVYRNYGCGTKDLFAASAWESKAEHLRAFMDATGPKGGEGNEAVEIGLQYANAEHTKNPINQIVLIGDAPPNTKAEVKSKRLGALGRCKSFFGIEEEYWKGSPYEVPTFYQDEVAKLQSQAIPVHALYVAHYAKAAFQEIASATKGTCMELDINSDRGASDLTDLVTQAVLKSLGGVKGQALVEAYRKAYCS